MTRPKIGALRHRVTIETPVDTQDDIGGFSRAYAPLTQVWARIEAVSADQDFSEARLEQKTRHVVTIRWRADVRAQMRFDHRGRKLVIQTVRDADRWRCLPCLCEEIT